MKIKSDNNWVQRLEKNLIKKYKNDPIFHYAVRVTIGGAVLVTFSYFALNIMIDKNLKEQEAMVEKIQSTNPIINCKGKYYFPDEYSVFEKSNYNIVSVYKPDRNIEEQEFTLGTCKIASKTMMDKSFVAAIIKKRENFLVAVEQIEKEYIDLGTVVVQAKKEENSTKPIRTVIVKVEENLTKEENDVEVKTPNSMHGYGYYERLELAEKTPLLQEAFAELEAYKKHNEIPKFGTQYSYELKELNHNYNTLRSRVWVLHNKWGQGSFENLERGTTTHYVRQL